MSDRKKKPVPEKPEIIERGPEQHEDDGNLHASGISRRDDGHAGKERVATDVERDNQVGPSEELDRAYGDRGSRDV